MLNGISKSVVQTLLEHRQAWGHDRFPGELVPVLDHLLSGELFPNIQSEYTPIAVKCIWDITLNQLETTDVES